MFKEKNAASVGEQPYWGHFRTYKIHNGFLCGVCRRTYAEEGEARTCVTGCVSPYANFTIDTLVRGMKTRYRCPFCYREYLDSNAANSCLARCKRHIYAVTGAAPYKDAYEHDLKLVKDEIPEFAVSVSRKDNALGLRNNRPTLAEITAKTSSQEAPQAPKKEKKSVAPLELSYAKQGSQTAPAEAPKPAPKPSAPAAIPAFTEPVPEAAPLPEPEKVVYDPNVKYRESGQKPFIRDNARYVCTVCNQKFFTKSEVEACFESHPLKPDV